MRLDDYVFRLLAKYRTQNAMEMMDAFGAKNTIGDGGSTALQLLKLLTLLTLLTLLKLFDTVRHC